MPSTSSKEDCTHKREFKVCRNVVVSLIHGNRTDLGAPMFVVYALWVCLARLALVNMFELSLKVPPELRAGDSRFVLHEAEILAVH